jgi:hypothetical protein
MTKTEILTAIKSGLEIVSSCNSIKLLVIDNEIYFGAIGTKCAIKLQNDNELKIYNWTLTSFSEHLAR